MAAEPPAPNPPTPLGGDGSFSQAVAEQFSLSAGIGGVRGVIESVVPYTVFSLVYVVTKDLQTSIVWALVPAVVLVVWRLIARETVQQALSGVLVIVIGALLAHWTGDAVQFFLPTILKNVGLAALYLVSILAGWPLVGVVVGPLTGELFAWRDDRPRLRAYRRATWLWVGLFLVRVAVQLPLYLADQVSLLGVLNGLVLGLPLYGFTIWLTWLVLRPVPLARTPEQRTADAAERTADGVERPADAAESPERLP
jgi:intracellular septation protein A